MFRLADYTAFRAEFLFLLRLRACKTTYERINVTAEWRKQQKRLTHHALPADVWRDDTPDTITIPTIGHRDEHTIIARPTEALALLAAAGLWHYTEEPPLIDIPVYQRYEKYCFKCEEHKPLKHFARDRRFSDGRHAYCNACRQSVRHQHWKRSA